jgi:hypothetical protein
VKLKTHDETRIFSRSAVLTTVRTKLEEPDELHAWRWPVGRTRPIGELGRLERAELSSYIGPNWR